MGFMHIYQIPDAQLGQPKCEGSIGTGLGAAAAFHCLHMGRTHSHLCFLCHGPAQRRVLREGCGSFHSHHEHPGHTWVPPATPHHGAPTVNTPFLLRLLPR